MLLAGHAAEKIIFGSCGYSYRKEDKQRAFDIAQSIAFEGIDIAQLPEGSPIKHNLFEKSYTLTQECEQDIASLLEQHKETLQNLADALYEHKTLTRDQVRSIIEHGSIIVQNNKTEPTASAKHILQELGIEEAQPA